MGNCLGSSTQVGSLQQVGSPSQLGCLNLRPLLKHDRKEIYEKLTTIFRKSYDYVNNLQQTFAAKEMQNSTAIGVVKKRVTKYSMMTNLSNEEAEQIAENTNKVLERYWFKRSKKIISSVINRLKDVIVSTDQQPTLSTLISKLETDCLQGLETAINQLSKDILEAKSTDEGENGRNESVDGLETGQTIEGPYDDKTEDRYWFKRSKEIISSVINRLKDVIVSTDQQKTLSKLISKLETDCLQWLEIAINQLSKDLNEAKSTDEGENGRNESVCGQTIEAPYDDKTEVFRLLFTCTLILGTERDNYSEICLYL